SLSDDELEELAALEDEPDEDLVDDAILTGEPTTDDRRPTTDDGQRSVVDQALLDELEQKMLVLLREIKQFTESVGDPVPIARELRNEMAVILQLPALDRRA